MSHVLNLVEELREIHDGNAWHGPSLKVILKGVGAAQAAALKVPDFRSIWQVVLHIAAWEEVFCQRIGGKALNEPEQGDWPPVTDTGEKAWQQAIAYLDQNHERLIDMVSALKDDDLQRIVPGKPYTISYMLSGLMRHHTYHAGQIALLKRM